MKGKNRILIDMDGVLIQSSKACMELYQKDKGIKIDWNVEDLQWNFQPYIPEEDVKQVLSYFSDQRMYDIAEPTVGSIESLRRLSKEFEIVIVTKSHRHALNYKSNWLYNNFYGIVDRIVYLNQDDFDKSFIEGFCIIDDKIQPLCEGDRHFRMLFGNYYYNQIENLTIEELKMLYDGMEKDNYIYRYNNWRDIENYLMNMN